MCWQELKHDLKAVKAGLSLMQMKYQQEFTSLGEILPYNKVWTLRIENLMYLEMVILFVLI